MELTIKFQYSIPEGLVLARIQTNTVLGYRIILLFSINKNIKIEIIKYKHM